MNLREHQDLQVVASNRHGNYTRAEVADATRKLAADRVVGTVFVPVLFGSGSGRGEAAEEIKATLRLKSVRQAQSLLRESTVECPNGATGYTDAAVAHAVGRDRVGTGSCTAYRVCEADPDSAYDCDIGAQSGRGWRML